MIVKRGNENGQFSVGRYVEFYRGFIIRRIELQVKQCIYAATRNNDISDDEIIFDVALTIEELKIKIYDYYYKDFKNYLKTGEKNDNVEKEKNNG